MIVQFKTAASGWQALLMSPTVRAGTFRASVPRTPTLGAGSAAKELDQLFIKLASLGSVPGAPGRGDPPLWLEDVYAQVDQRNPETAVDIIFSHMNDLLAGGCVARCNEVLRAIDLMRLDTNAIVATLSITLTAASQLPYRTRFLERAEKRLQQLAPGRVGRLLSGLR
ncbi:MAG: hypothetical protein HY815_01705 [Candidatus Riflebacteria bacterium]|nr:hypothetical protein [Candidatus Riflebacteria bacterium]